MPATMRDVAERAGVSIKTVSRVVNDQGEISEATRLHVRKTIKELGYRPNSLARGLVSGKTATVALLLPRLTDPGAAEFVEGAESVARREGYGLFLCHTCDDAKGEWDAVESFAAKRVDGLLLFGSRLSEKKLKRIPEEHGLPLAALTPHAPKNALVFRIAEEEGMREMVSHLLGLGHRALGYVGWISPDEDARSAGHRHALEEHGIKPKKRRIVFVPRSDPDAGYAAAKLLFLQSPEITAVAAHDDDLAAGAVRACLEAGRRVPDEISVTGFGDLPSTSLTVPSLTTMRVPRRLLGERMMERLLHRIAGEAGPEEPVCVKPELVVRESCGSVQPSEDGPSEEGLTGS